MYSTENSEGRHFKISKCWERVYGFQHSRYKFLQLRQQHPNNLRWEVWLRYAYFTAVLLRHSPKRQMVIVAVSRASPNPCKIEPCRNTYTLVGDFKWSACGLLRAADWFERRKPSYELVRRKWCDTRSGIYQMETIPYWCVMLYDTCLKSNERAAPEGDKVSKYVLCFFLTSKDRIVVSNYFWSVRQATFPERFSFLCMR